MLLEALKLDLLLVELALLRLKRLRLARRRRLLQLQLIQLLLLFVQLKLERAQLVRRRAARLGKGRRRQHQHQRQENDKAFHPLGLERDRGSQQAGQAAPGKGVSKRMPGPLRSLAMARRLWFKAKTYGWGWTPATWEGWAVTIADLAAVLGWTMYVATHPALAARPDFVWLLLLPIVALATLLMIVCWLKGERPRWRWGK